MLAARHEVIVGLAAPTAGGLDVIDVKVPKKVIKDGPAIVTMALTFLVDEAFPQVVAIDLKQISKMIGTEVAGVAGYDFFSNYKIIIDYYGAEIRLSK